MTHRKERQLADFVQTAKELQQGNLSVRFPVKRNEFQELGEVLNGALENLERECSEARGNKANN